MTNDANAADSSASASSRWTDALLDAKRLETDPVADAVVESLLAGGESAVMTANDLFQLLSENDQPPPDLLPPAVQRYFVETASLPAWADPDLIKTGERVFNAHGAWMVTSLLCSGLPQCYAAARGAQVLYRTGRMVDQFHRRIVETAQFLLDVMAPDGLAPTGSGIRTTQKVRLVHAAIRSFIARDRGWDPAWGAPINQADLAGTLLAFSTVAMDGLERMGVKLSPTEREACFHAWRVVGHVLGIQDEMLPSDTADARALWQAIQRRENVRSDAGVALTTALLDFVHSALPGTVFDGMADVTVRHLVGEEVADMLAVPRHDGPHVTLRIVRFFDVVVSDEEEAVSPIQSAMAVLNRHLIVGLEASWRGGNRTRFEIPPSLRGSWGLSG